MARHKAPPGVILLKRLKGLEGKSSQGLSLLLISLSALPSEEEDKFWGELDEIKRMQNDGLIFVLARLDDESGIKVGQDLGITVFQGFCIDDLMESAKPEAMVT
jgi:hypothetical protein